MPNLTLKNIPEALFDQLKSAAKRHHRSIKSELIRCIEKEYGFRRINPGDRIERARQIRSRFRVEANSEEILRTIDEGRP